MFVAVQSTLAPLSLRVAETPEVSVIVVPFSVAVNAVSISIAVTPLIVCVHGCPAAAVRVLLPLTVSVKSQPFGPMYSIVPGDVPSWSCTIPVNAVVVLLEPHVNVCVPVVYCQVPMNAEVEPLDELLLLQARGPAVKRSAHASGGKRWGKGMGLPEWFCRAQGAHISLSHATAPGARKNVMNPQPHAGLMGGRPAIGHE